MPCQLTCLLDDRGDLLRRCPRKWQSPSPPAFETAAASSGVTAPPMGASTIGTSIPTRSHSGVRTQRVYGTAASVIKQAAHAWPAVFGGRARPGFASPTLRRRRRPRRRPGTRGGPRRQQDHAALAGSSYLKLPGVLRFFTGNIGFHHVHHLSVGIPNYNLQAAH